MFDPSHWFIFGAWFLGGFVNGISGMGAGLVSLPIAASLLPMQELVPASGLSTLTVACYLVWAYRRYCRWSSLRHMLVGCLPGALLGVWILRSVPSAGLLSVMGMGLIGFVGWQFCHRAGQPHKETWLAGGLAGFSSACAHAAITFSGPPLAVYAVYAGWEQKTALGTMSIFFLGVNVLSCCLLGMAGMFTLPVLEFGFWGSAGATAGLLAAMPLVKYVRGEVFRRILLGMIGLAGVVCLARAAAQP